MTPVNILLVDDRQENLIALQAVLRHPRYRLISARSGLEALACLTEAAYAAILLDVQMPDMDGYETARRIKSDARYRDIPIIFVTAIYTDQIQIFRGYDAGAIDYLLKPFDDHVLRSKVSVLADLFEKNDQLEQHRLALAHANDALRKEIRERQRAEQALRAAHAELEERVRTRTLDLAASNAALQQEIIARTRIGEQLRASVQEKEVLLKEIHHRVKNNLQIISSFLSLQATEVQDQRALTLFRDSQERIRSMALVHETLYHSKDLGKIEMSAYIQRLGNHLLRTYKPSALDLQLDLQVEEGFFDIDTAIPCGLMLNELASNALKHAFRGRQAGRLTIVLRQEEPDHYLLIVQDDGIGLPADLETRDPGSLGLVIVDALVQQLQGRLELQRAPGTTFVIRFLSKSHAPLATTGVATPEHVTAAI